VLASVGVVPDNADPELYAMPVILVALSSTNPISVSWVAWFSFSGTVVVKSVEGVIVTSVVARDTKEVVAVRADEGDPVIVMVEEDDMVIAVAEDTVAVMVSGLVVGFAVLHVMFVSMLS